MIGKALAAALVLAWAATAALLTATFSSRGPFATGIAVTLLAIYFGVSLRRRGAGDPWSALPFLLFLAPAAPLLAHALERPDAALRFPLAEAAPVLAAVAAGHLVLLRAAPARPAASLAILIAGVFLASTAIQVLRFALFLPAGHPEDTAFMWASLRSWADGGAPVSPWSVVWGHRGLEHLFGLHFSPIVWALLPLIRVVPSLSVLLLLQGALVLAGLALMARQAAAPIAPRGWPEASRWGLLLLVASPPLGAALRGELQPLLWALPSLAWLHGAYERRARASFVAAALSVFLFREDLGFVVAAYAPLALLAGRRRERFWILAPLGGAAATLAIMTLVMPRFGVPGAAFFPSVFATPAAGLLPFLGWLLAHPLELLLRLARPDNLLVLLRLALTGVAIPLRTWAWLPALPLACLFSLTGRHLTLLRIDSHYVTIPALFLVAAGLASWLPRLAALAPQRRRAACVALAVLGFVQTTPLAVPPPRALLHPAAWRRETFADLALVPPGRPAWIPVSLMLAAPDPRYVVLHRLALEAFGPCEEPRLALLTKGAPEQAEGRMLTTAYRLEGPIASGARHDLWALVPLGSDDCTATAPQSAATEAPRFGVPR